MSSEANRPTACGVVASLHLHPDVAGAPLKNASEIFVEAGKGIVGNTRYFARKTRLGEQSRRQVTLIAREQIAEHAAALGGIEIPAGAVRSNIETTGIDLNSLVGHEVQVGEAILAFYDRRTPCGKMDRVASGLKNLMAGGRQGVLAQVIQSGRIRVGDAIRDHKLIPTTNV
jgi:MOSC domain-containing protein YiiM